MIVASCVAFEAAPADAGAQPPEPGTRAPVETPAPPPDAAAPAASPGEPTTEPPAQAAAAPRWRWSALPNASYDSDDRFGLGARAQLDRLAPGVEPYRASFVVHLFATTNGFQHQRFRFDLVDLGPEGNLRLTGHVAYRAWLNDGYWGIGNGTTRDARWEGHEDPEDSARKHYRYRLIQPFTNLTLRADLGGPWRVYGSTQLRWSHVEAYPGSLLDETQPEGMEGGPALQLGGGVLFDTRNPEVTPQRGLLLEAGARAVEGFDGPPFGGPFLSARGYVPFGPRLTFAARWMGEYLFGEVPFYELVHWGGFVPIAGFGGADTLRGISFGRWRAPGKTVLDTEWRLDVLEHTLAKEPLRWQLVPFADVGAVFGAGEAADAPPPANPLHPSAGLGVRAIWATTLVGRADLAVGEDKLVDPQGELISIPNIGFYLAFDHTF